MKDKLPSNKTTILEKVSLSKDEKKLMVALDKFYPHYGVTGIKASRMLEGAIFAIRRECRENPDMLAQAAHSLREILNPFKSRENIKKTVRKLNEYDKRNNPEANSLEMNDSSKVSSKKKFKQFKKALYSDFPNYKNHSSEIDDLYRIFLAMAHHKYSQTCSHLKALREYLDKFVEVMLKATMRQDKIITDIENTDMEDIELNNSTDKNE